MKAQALALLLAVMSGNFCHAELVSASAPDGTPAALRLTVDAKAREADVLVDANRGGLRYYCQNTYQTLWLDGPALKALEAAAQKYNKQFEARALRRGKKATAACYGTLQAQLEWGSARSAMTRSAPAKLKLGYVFWENSPYFCLNVPSVQSRQSPQDPALATSESPRLLLTRPQLSSFLNLCLEGMGGTPF